jgi:hypothetical protein
MQSSIHDALKARLPPGLYVLYALQPLSPRYFFGGFTFAVAVRVKM